MFSNILERGGVPYCERLHGVELPLLQPPSHSEVCDTIY